MEMCVCMRACVVIAGYIKLMPFLSQPIEGIIFGIAANNILRGDFGVCDVFHGYDVITHLHQSHIHNDSTTRETKNIIIHKVRQYFNLETTRNFVCVKCLLNFEYKVFILVCFLFCRSYIYCTFSRYCFSFYKYFTVTIKKYIYFIIIKKCN